MKKRLIIIAVFLLSIFGLYWIFGHSFIEISVNGATANAPETYSLMNQGSNEKIDTIATATKIKKIVSKGSYEITVRQGSNNYFAVAKASGFMRVAHISGTLSTEKSREFVGNVPQPCVHTVGGILASFPCEGSYASVLVHKPAVGSLASYTVPVSNPPSNSQIIGFVNLKDGSFVLTKHSAEEDVTPQYIMYKVNSGYQTSSGVLLPELDGDKDYSMVAHKDGFVIYSKSYDDVQYYQFVGSKPQKIEFNKTMDESMVPRSINFNDDNIAALYVGRPDGTDKEARSDVAAKINGVTKQLSFSGAFYSAVLCGSNKLCLLNDAGLGVYDIANKKPELVFVVNNVSSITNTNKGLVAVNPTGVLNLDVDQQSGFYEYTFGDYKFNKIQVTDESIYVLSLTNNKSREVALLVDQDKPNSDGIDKDAAALQKMPEVSFVTIYDKNIYVSANLGELVYSSAIDSYTYNPTTQKAVAAKINAEIDKLGIDRKVYTITSNAF